MDPLSSVVEPLAIAANCAQILGTVATNPFTSHRGHASLAQREQAYLEFGRATSNIVGSAIHLRALASMGQPPADRITRAKKALRRPDISLLEKIRVFMGSFADEASVERARRAIRAVLSVFPEGLIASSRFERVGLHTLAPVARMSLARDLVGDLITQWSAIDAVSQARDTVAGYTGALNTVRLMGGREPRDDATKITMLLTELFGRLSESDEDFNACLIAIGSVQEDFLLSARTELGRSWWQRGTTSRARPYQVWRPRKLEKSSVVLDFDARSLISSTVMSNQPEQEK